MQTLYDNIPIMLKQCPNWVAWGIRGSPLKSPFNPESLLAGNVFFAKAGMKETWGSYQNAVECVRCGKAQGIGYEFDGDVYGIDLDHVIDGNGVLTSQAQEIVDKLNSYTEISPSGTGLHIFVSAPDAEIICHRKKDFFLEIYNEKRYFTVTGNVYGETKPIEIRTEELRDVHDKFLLPEVTPKTTLPPPFIFITSDFSHEQFLHIGLERDKVLSALWNGKRRHGNESSDDIALMNKLAYWCNADPDTMIQAFLQSPYYSQKDEPHKKKCQRSDYLPNTAKKACATVYSTAVVDCERRQLKSKNERSCMR